MSLYYRGDGISIKVHWSKGFLGAGRGNRTPTELSPLRILSPLRLPISPSRLGVHCSLGIWVGSDSCDANGKTTAAGRPDKTTPAKTNQFKTTRRLPPRRWRRPERSRAVCAGIAGTFRM